MLYCILVTVLLVSNELLPGAISRQGAVRSIHHFSDGSSFKPAFSPFPTMFFPLSYANFNILVAFILLSANASNLDQCNNLSCINPLPQNAAF